MGQITKLNSNVQIEQTLPHSEEIIKMNMIEGWENCSEQQKAFLCVYFQLYPKEMKSCMQSGTSQNKYNKWIAEDSNFVRIMNTIEKIHMEELEAKEYQEAYADKTVRGRVLDNKHKEKRPAKGSTNIFVTETTMDKYLSR